jgi:SPP1 family predicted phage head-tail adaptor
MAKYQPGQLDKLIKIQRETLTGDGIGGDDLTWVDVSEEWAKAEPLSGAERPEADRPEAQARYMFVIRHRSDLLDTDRIVFNGQNYDIDFIQDEGPRPTYLEINAFRGGVQ